MFQRAAATDTKVIVSGLIILLTIIIVGVGIVEHQLATLTQRPAQERLFSIGPSEKTSVLEYVFRFTLPIKTKFDTLQSRKWCTLWYQQFINEAFLAKKTFSEYWRQAKPYIEVTFQNLKNKACQAVDELAEHIHEYR